jgi:nitrite reductase/ring-hydroxylating ferredoxin subunit
MASSVVLFRFLVVQAGSRNLMDPVSRLENAQSLDRLTGPLQRAVRLVPGPLRDVLHGVRLGHPLHPVLVQVPLGTWLSAALIGMSPGGERAARRLTIVGLAATGPAALTGATDWAEQHEQHLRVGMVHAAANWAAAGLFAASLGCRGHRAGQAMRLAGLTVASAGGLLGGHLSFRLAGGANHAEAVPHLVEPGWHYLMPEHELPDATPVRRMLGDVPVVAIRHDGEVHVLSDQCSHLAGSLSEGQLTGGTITCPWHHSRFCLADGSVDRGPATAPQPRFSVRTVGGAIQVMLPGAG